MRPTLALVLAVSLALSACSDDGTAAAVDATSGASASQDDSDTIGDANGDDADDVDGSAGASTTTSDGVDASDDASDGVDASDDAATGDGTDTSAGGGPIELYRGPVVGAVVPGWTPDDPRPLVMLGRQGDDWIATLARIGDDGSLSDNLAEELVVWGWDAAPPLLYDGPVLGGAIPDWSPDDPTPVVMLGRLEADASWVATLASIGPDGTLGDNFADRIVVWGWPPATPDAPQLRYVGPIDAGAVLRGWNADEPVPMVLLGRLADSDVWQSTLARIGPDGTLSDNLAAELNVWGW